MEDIIFCIRDAVYRGVIPLLLNILWQKVHSNVFSVSSSFGLCTRFLPLPFFSIGFGRAVFGPALDGWVFVTVLLSTATAFLPSIKIVNGS